MRDDTLLLCEACQAGHEAQDLSALGPFPVASVSLVQSRLQLRHTSPHGCLKYWVPFVLHQAVRMKASASFRVEGIAGARRMVFASGRARRVFRSCFAVIRLSCHALPLHAVLLVLPSCCPLRCLARRTIVGGHEVEICVFVLALLLCAAAAASPAAAAAGGGGARACVHVCDGRGGRSVRCHQ